jgi:hypothetical protein
MIRTSFVELIQELLRTLRSDESGQHPVPVGGPPPAWTGDHLDHAIKKGNRRMPVAALATKCFARHSGTGGRINAGNRNPADGMSQHADRDRPSQLAHHLERDGQGSSTNALPALKTAIDNSLAMLQQNPQQPVASAGKLN